MLIRSRRPCFRTLSLEDSCARICNCFTLSYMANSFGETIIKYFKNIPLSTFALQPCNPLFQFMGGYKNCSISSYRVFFSNRTVGPYRIRVDLKLRDRLSTLHKETDVVKRLSLFKFLPDNHYTFIK